MGRSETLLHLGASLGITSCATYLCTRPLSVLVCSRSVLVLSVHVMQGMMYSPCPLSSHAPVVSIVRPPSCDGICPLLHLSSDVSSTHAPSVGIPLSSQPAPLSLCHSPQDPSSDELNNLFQPGPLIAVSLPLQLFHINRQPTGKDHKADAAVPHAVIMIVWLRGSISLATDGLAVHNCKS